MKGPFLVLCLALSVACAGQAVKKPGQGSTGQTAAKPLPIATLVEVSADDKTGVEPSVRILNQG
jgi:hypothetical protein